jgi:hypothetical protein
MKLEEQVEKKMEFGHGSMRMALVFKNGETLFGNNIPEVAFDRLKEFVISTGYKGDIRIPIGPYDQLKYNHVRQSFKVLQMLGRLREIIQIEVTDNGVHLVSGEGESHSITTGTLNWDSDLQKVLRSCRKSYL